LDLVQVPDLQQGSEALDTALAGSQYVFHVASPFRFDGDPDLDIVQPAVRGTKAVLEAAAKQKPGLKRVVVTSSVCGKQASVEQLLPDLHYVIMYGDYQL
jgi:nucleoside-diphosphate-sugar epimerase